ncbi:Adult-specific rigid cuticular protein 15.7 [Araneus ventricosus]|uniref:Adult-specific rigid cuticular protein 15.7 n=1 Tax=Araneus ventricosus TaxID=182803 RepID=A0A4Y2M6C2_ARAVE|nr:Adult-specific rigid cuticular protein 15.7 [Araneus ventricosus]
MFAKVAILLVAVAAAQASVLYGGHAALVNTGVSTSGRSQDAFGNYAFNYGIQDGLGAANSRAEVGDAHGNKKGSYSIADIDGRARRVDYVADAHGFRATVKTNEPGTAASAPARRLIAGPYAGPIAPRGRPCRPCSLRVESSDMEPPLAAPVAYGGASVAGVSCGLGAPLGLGYGLGYGKGLIH